MVIALLLIFALVFFGVGIFVAAAKWAIIIGLILVVASAITHFANRRT